MAREFSRTNRIGEVLQRELAQMIQHEVSDPRVGFVTVSHVDVTSDLKYAKVYITRMKSDDTESDQTMFRRFDSCFWFLKKRLGESR
jgi:ribosome-binding factor A